MNNSHTEWISSRGPATLVTHQCGTLRQDYGVLERVKRV